MRRELVLDLSQCAAEAGSEYVRERLGQDCRPGIESSPSPPPGTWSPRTPADHGWWLLERRRLSPARKLGRGNGDEAVPRTPAYAPNRAPRDLGAARAEARRLDTSGLLLARRY